MSMMRRRSRAVTMLGGLLIGLVLGWGVPSSVALAQEPPPRPTLEPTTTPIPPTPIPPTSVPPTSVPPTSIPPTSAPPADNADQPTQPPTGRIIGTVIDLTTGAPAPGIAVAVGDAVITTDANGNYERGSLPAGSYPLALKLTPSQGTPAQDPLVVVLGANMTVVQHLSFNQPVPPTPQPTIAPPPPTAAPPPPNQPIPAPAQPAPQPQAPRSARQPQAQPAASEPQAPAPAPRRTLPATGAENVVIWVGGGILLALSVGLLGVGLRRTARRQRGGA